MADINVPMLNLSEISQLPENVAGMGLTQAQTGVQQGLATQLGISNQRDAINLGLLKGAIQDFSGQLPGQGAPGQGGTGEEATPGAPPPGAPQGSPSNNSGVASPAAAPGASALANGLPVDTAGVQAALRQHFWVDPQGTPAQQRYMGVAALSGSPQLQAYAKYQRDRYVAQQTAENQKNANLLYDMMGNVLSVPDSAPKGTAFTTLARIAPEAAAHLRAEVGANGDLDGAARHYANTIAANVHQYTGRGIETLPDGTQVDAVTHMPVAGVKPSGLTPEAYAKLASSLAQMKPVTQRDGSVQMVPQYKLTGYPDLKTAVMSVAAKGGQYYPGMPGAQQHRDAITQASSDAESGKVSSVLSPQEIKSNPGLAKALQDPQYDMPKFDGPANTGPSTIQQQQQQEIGKAWGDLQNDAKTTALAASTQQTYLAAALKVLNAPENTPLRSLGLPGAVYTMISRLGNSVSATNRQEMVKNLSNAALQYAKQNFNNSRMSTQEVKMALTDMNPSVENTPEALRNLIKEQMAIAKYFYDGSQYTVPYLKLNKNPINYYNWYTTHFPMSDTVLGSTGKSDQGSSRSAPKSASGYPLTNSQGWRLMQSNGVEAYVNPKNPKQFTVVKGK